ncbi:MAG: hypothetical protein M3296_05920 [Actinomycetota bacterium]|nr:hypothetical protein [Actinomycetota bacterium]
MSTTVLILLSGLEAVILVVVLAIALIRIRIRLTTISEGLVTLSRALATVEMAHLSPLQGAVTAINERLSTIVSVLPGIAKKAALVVKMSQEEAST